MFQALCPLETNTIHQPKVNPMQPSGVVHTVTISTIIKDDSAIWMEVDGQSSSKCIKSELMVKAKLWKCIVHSTKRYTIEVLDNHQVVTSLGSAADTGLAPECLGLASSGSLPHCILSPLSPMDPVDISPSVCTTTSMVSYNPSWL